MANILREHKLSFKFIYLPYVCENANNSDLQSTHLKGLLNVCISSFMSRKKQLKTMIELDCHKTMIIIFLVWKFNHGLYQIE